MKSYPSGRYAKLAELKLKKLKPLSEPTMVAPTYTPPPTPPARATAGTAYPNGQYAEDAKKICSGLKEDAPSAYEDCLDMVVAQMKAKERNSRP